MATERRAGAQSCAAPSQPLHLASGRRGQPGLGPTHNAPGPRPARLEHTTSGLSSKQLAPVLVPSPPISTGRRSPQPLVDTPSPLLPSEESPAEDGVSEVPTPRGRGVQKAEGEGRRERGQDGGVGEKTAPPKELAFARGWKRSPPQVPNGPLAERQGHRGSRGPQPPSLSRASDKAPLTRAPLCVCIFFPLPLTLGTGRPAASSPSPALRLPSRGGLPFPGSAPGPGDAFSARRAGDPSPSGPSRLEARWGRAGATRGAGGPEPSTPEVPPRGWGGDPGARR